MVSAYTWGTIKMICPKCKEVYEDGSVFCVSCGTRLVSEDFKVSEGDPIKRHSSRFKTSKPKNEPKDVPEMENKQEIKKETDSQFQLSNISNDNKLDILIIQNKELIKQNNRIIELLEKLAN